MPNATLVMDYREALSPDFIVTVKIWLVPVPVPGSSHSFKYSMFFGRPGERAVLYDNERGKGDHRHYGDTEERYMFISIEQLMTDFNADIRRIREILR